jgi:hypothetical protein
MSHRQPDNAALGTGSTSKRALSEADEHIISDKSTRASMKFLELNALEMLQRHTGFEVLLMILSLLGCYAVLTAGIRCM